MPHKKLTKMSQFNGQHLSDLFATVPLRGRQFYIVLHIEQLFYLYYQPTNQPMRHILLDELSMRHIIWIIATLRTCLCISWYAPVYVDRI